MVNNLIDHVNRHTSANCGKMSWFVVLVASGVCSWAIRPSRGMLVIAVSTIPAAWLE